MISGMVDLQGLVLAYGHGVRQNWEGIHLIMHYSIYFWVLLVLQNQNWLALDNKRAEWTSG